MNATLVKKEEEEERQHHRQRLAAQCTALIRVATPVDVAQFLACFLFGAYDLCGFNVDLCRFWMMTARQRLGQGTPLERVALFLSDLTSLRPDFAVETDAVPGNKFSSVLYPFGRRRARNLRVDLDPLPVLVKEAIHYLLASVELRSHGEHVWSGILWFESYEGGNRVMSEILDKLRPALLGAAMRAFYLETKQVVQQHLDNHQAKAREFSAKHLAAAIHLVVNTPQLPCSPHNAECLTGVLRHMSQHGFSKRALRKLAEAPQKSLTLSSFVSSAINRSLF